ncbi:MAG: N-acetylmuramic acid 6-phosphate etherase [Propioniciclava sp.]
MESTGMPQAADLATPEDLVAFPSPTEERNPRTMDIDSLAGDQIVERILTEDAAVLEALRTATSAIAALTTAAVATLRGGGRIHYVGAGTSGRLGVLDAVELRPTFGVGEESVVAHLAGGPAAMFRSVEGAEDDLAAGRSDVADLRAGDLLVGLAASGRTPYVQAAMQHARDLGVPTALMTANPHGRLLELADIAIVLETGPEVVTGSTRMKAASAQKMALNAFSTATMIQLGKTYSNLMVDVAPSNGKLRARVIRLITQATGVSSDAAAAALQAAEGDLKVALVSVLTGGQDPPISSDRIRDALRVSGGEVRTAVAVFTTAQPEHHHQHEELT